MPGKPPYQTRWTGLLIGLLCGAWALLSFAPPTQALSRREQRKRYRKLRRQLRKGYKAAIKQRYREPCRAYVAIPAYMRWLATLAQRLPKQPLRRWQRRRLQRSARYYTRRSRSQLRRVKRRCLRRWKQEWKRKPPRPMSKKCQRRFEENERSREIWIAVRPWAYVYVDDMLCGNAPMRLTLPQGRYQIRLDYPPSKDSHKQDLEVPSPKKRRRRRRKRKPKPLLLVHWMNTAPPPSRKQPDVLSSKQISWVLKRQKQSLKSCRIYQPSVSTIKLSWRVSPEGKAQDVRWSGPENAKKRFRRCILRAASRWRFPKARANANIQDYAIQLD